MPFPESVGGTFAVADWVSLEALRLLVNMLEMASFANFTYQDEFKKDFQPGDTIRVKFPQEFMVIDGFPYTAQGLDRRTTTVTIDQPLQIAFEWDSIEEALRLERTEEQIRNEYLEPAMAQMCQEFELRWMDFCFFACNNVVGGLDTVPTSWDVYAQARQRMVENAGWGAAPRRGIGVTPGMMRTLITNSLVQFNPTDEISAQYKTGSIGRAAGWEWFESMATHQHTTGFFGATPPATTTALQAGGTLEIAGAAAHSLNVGDIFSITGVYNVNPRTRRKTATLKQFKVLSALPSGTGTRTVNIQPPIIGPPSPYQNVDQLPAAGAALILWPGTQFQGTAPRQGVLGIGLNKLFAAMAGIELMMPTEGGVVNLARQRRDPNTGISIAIISMFDGILRRQINRIDALIGFGQLYHDRCGVLVASSE